MKTHAERVLEAGRIAKEEQKKDNFREELKNFLNWHYNRSQEEVENKLSWYDKYVKEVKN